ncbi:MAG: tetratricopeptide repeat protein, partial [Bacteroidetes bacterium]|nr:tetratricopeptide repeat protein [Bacteroidota bacterium]
AYENYANALPEDTISAEYLYRAAEIAMNLQMAGRAIEYYQRILNNFPDFDKRSYCLFLEAFVYENQMQQYETAEKLYLEFIEKYPDHPLADDAEVSVQNMGKSLEELIQSWESQENK